MYALKEIETQGLQFIELASSDATSKAVICLNQGGRLSDFVFEKIQILADFHPSAYQDNYASSVLFPFANRIKGGAYTFNDSKYILDCNEKGKSNALHGLVYNKAFVCIHKTLTSDYASITLQYKDEGKNKGFPFKFNIELTYTLNSCGIALSVKIKNEDKRPFPFTLGWHPYFNSKDLDYSSIDFNSNSKYLFDHQQIISGTTSLGLEMPFQLKGVKLDDGYPLQTNEVEFLTPEYGFKFTSTSKENFLHLFTPDQPKVIAIEPMTGAANNFNNKIGLQTLEPNDVYKVEWDIAIDTLNTKVKSNKLINKLCNS
ncbi:MAG: aldose 1-epimerase [Flavobacteriaceae bacterium]|uniref:aldose 1-epimerase n=1 Tax=Candidatus Marifrigoribacter sp. Uisw_064 TaxID=3230970 RepID=UPI003AE1BE74